MLFEWNVELPYITECSNNLSFLYEDSTIFEIDLTVFQDKVLIQLKKTEDKLTLTRVYKVKVSAFNYYGAKMEIPFNILTMKSNDQNDTSESYTFICLNEIVDLRDIPSNLYFMLKCDVSVPTGNMLSKIEGYKFGKVSLGNIPKLTNARLTLQDDLHHMYLEEKHCDVKLKTKDKVMPAHICLLAARSPVFSAMFDHDLSESRSGTVDIPDVETEVMQSFLEFLYSETLTNSSYEHIFQLILVAEKYQVQTLKARCSRILMSILSLGNACQLAALADSINDHNFKMYILDYIKDNKNQILSSPDWLELADKNSKLAIQILTRLSID